MSSDKVTLRDIYSAVESLESKIDKRMIKIEDRQDKFDSSLSNLFGKLSVLGIVASAIFTYAWNKLTGQNS